MKNQKLVWNNIAEEWNIFRDEPHEKVAKFIKKSKGKILDLGCGAGRNLIKQKNTKFYEVDFSKKMLELAKLKAKKRKVDAEFFLAPTYNLPFENNFFDVGVFVAVLQCIEDSKKREKSVKELFRVLKKGAKVYVAVWNIKSRYSNGKKERYIKWRDKGERYYYFYSEEEIFNLFKKIGFKIISKSNNLGMISFIAEKN